MASPPEGFPGTLGSDIWDFYSVYCPNPPVYPGKSRVLSRGMKVLEPEVLHNPQSHIPYSRGEVNITDTSPWSVSSLRQHRQANSSAPSLLLNGHLGSRDAS